jgi:alternate signal-mediated exported protein
MNKLLKGAIAGAAGVALLLGGAGTFALWNSSATVSAGTVKSGTLSLVTTPGTATWADVTKATPTDITSSIATYRIVPGGSIEMTQNLTINASGNRLSATLAYDPASIVKSGPATPTAADTELVANLAVSVTVDVTANANVVSSGTNEFTVTPSASTITVPVKVRLTLPVGVSGITAQNGTVNFSGLSFTLTQIAP